MFPGHESIMHIKIPKFFLAFISHIQNIKLNKDAKELKKILIERYNTLKQKETIRIENLTRNTLFIFVLE